MAGSAITAARAMKLTTSPASNSRSTLQRSKETVARWGPAFGGPLLIIAAVLVLQATFLFGSSVPNQRDILDAWLPTWCFLGKSLAAGHIPALNPHVMAGIPFAADPQSGWMHLQEMLVFSALPCGTALRIHLVLQPVVGGLGIYWFLRSESASRPAASIGGLVLACAVASSSYFQLPWVSSSLAWTALMLAAASRLFRSRHTSSQLAWVAATALAWGQLAASHFGNELVVGTAVLGAYVVSALTRMDTHPERRRLLSLAMLLVVALPAINLAYLLPRLHYLPHTSLVLGFDRLDRLSRQLSLGEAGGYVEEQSHLTATWPFSFAMRPGLYLGGVALILSFAAWWDREYRRLATMLAAVSAACYLLAIGSVATALSPALRHLPAASLYLHAPSRFVPGVVLSLAILAGLGAESWLRRPSIKTRVLMAVPGLALWVLLPAAFGASLRGLAEMVLAFLLAVAVLAAGARPGLWKIAGPIVLAVDLTVAGLAGHVSALRAEGGRIGPLNPALTRSFDLEAWIRKGPIGTALSMRTSRYLSVDPGDWRPQGYLVFQNQGSHGLLGAQQSMFMGLEEAQGYNSLQLLRYWKFVRTVDPKAIRYSAAYFKFPPPVALDLLQVGFLIGPAAGSPVEGGVQVAREGPWALYRLPATPPRASVVGIWRIAASADTALARVADPAFDPERVVVLEAPALARAGAAMGASPGSSPGSGVRSNAGQSPGQATYVALSSHSARIDVTSSRSAIVLVRNSYDPNWKAIVDGRHAPVLPADYVIQGIPVGPGHHTIILEYDDPWIGYGLLGSVLSLVLLVGAVIVSGRRDSKVSPRSPLQSTSSAEIVGRGGPA